MQPSTLQSLGLAKSKQPTKICCTCQQLLPLTSYRYSAKLASGKFNPRNECKNCKQEKDRQVQQLRRQHPRPQDLNYQCPCCGQTEQEIKATGKFPDRTVWCLDHNHATGKFRGWICNDCNRIAGISKDNVGLLRIIADYIEHNGVVK